eukprot:m.428859 g.428859  ORF g.428859 m.428859 type:complete len:277 (-) comp56710_c0_seq2:92-922(-)
MTACSLACYLWCFVVSPAAFRLVGVDVVCQLISSRWPTFHTRFRDSRISRRATATQAHTSTHIHTHPQDIRMAFDFAAVLDFEAVCEQGVRIQPQEIIEWPTVLFDLRSRTVVDEFHFYIKPRHHPTLTAFCTELTGITQAVVDAGLPMEDVFDRHIAWLRSHGLDPDNPFAPGHSFTYVTCGNWDLKSCLPPLLATFRLRQHACFRQWVNVKEAFESVTKQRGRGMAEMLSALKQPLVGRHHSGIDDARNILQILRTLIARGYVLHIPGDAHRHA